MSRLRVQAFSVSVDGFGAGPNQNLDNPIGVDGLKMMDWVRSTRTFQQMYGDDRRDCKRPQAHGQQDSESQSRYAGRRHLYGREAIGTNRFDALHGRVIDLHQGRDRKPDVGAERDVAADRRKQSGTRLA